MTVELEELEERGELIFTQGRVHARGGASGAEAMGPPVAAIYTFRDGRVRMIEWHYDIDEARARFEEER